MKTSTYLLSLCLILGACSRDVPGLLAPNEPIQTSPSSKASWESEGFTIEPLADYDTISRVLARETYRHPLSPLDLALGWGEMSDPAVYDKLIISQSGRWYHYKWLNAPPIPVIDIIKQSANVHMIPKDDHVRKILMKIDEGDVVRLKGKLVRVTKSSSQFTWVSSLSRNDSGDGACELMWVEEIEMVVD